MVGIAGGVPNPSSPDKHVRLGDVVISTHGVVQYDNLKIESTKVAVRSEPVPASSLLLGKANILEANRLTGSHPWERAMDRAKELTAQSIKGTNRRREHPAEGPESAGQLSASGRIDLPVLGSASFISANWPSATLSAPKLSSVGYLYANEVDSLDSLQSISVKGWFCGGALTLPSLKSAGSLTFLCESELLLLERLEEVDDLLIEGAVNEVRLPKLARVRNGLSIEIYGGEPVLDLPALESTRSLHLRMDNHAEASLSLPALQDCQDLVLSTEYGRLQVDAPALRWLNVLQAHGDMELTLAELVSVRDLQARWQVQLALDKLIAVKKLSASLEGKTPFTFGLPALTQADELVIANSYTLSDLSFPNLTTVTTSIGISGNRQLPTARAQALVDQLVGFEGMVAIENNAP